MLLPTISIVTPSFNHAPHIQATISSVLRQDYPNLQYLVMDGGSTDGTVDILKKYDSRLRWISRPDRGQADAINQGFAQTTGEILGWLNSDDLYAPGALAAVGDFFAAHPEAIVVYGNADFVDVRGDLIRRCAFVEPFNRHRLLHYSDFLVQPATFFRRGAFEKVGGLDASLNWAMDYDLWLKLAALGSFHRLPNVLAHYRWLNTSKTGAGGWERLREVGRVASKHGKNGLPAYFRLEAVRLHLKEASESARGGRVGRAAVSTASAIGQILLSPRAMRSLISFRIWKIIWAGQVLRSHDRKTRGK